MNILITGAKGFIGKNLIAELKNRGFNEILEFTRDSDPVLLENYTKQCDFVFHLAGVNRPQNERDFIEGNYNFTSQLLALLKKHGNKAPIVTTSSIQAELNNQINLVPAKPACNKVALVGELAVPYACNPLQQG